MEIRVPEVTYRTVLAVLGGCFNKMDDALAVSVYGMEMQYLLSYKAKEE